MQKNGFIAMAVLALGGAVMFGAPLLAGEGTPKAVEKGGMRLIEKNGFFAPLDLTNAQKAAVEGIMAQDKLAFAAAGGDVTKLRALKQATWQRIMAALTPAQRQKLAAAKGFELENGPGREMRMPELGSLGLTPDQEARLRSILEQGTPRARAIEQDKSLSDQQKMAGLTALYQEFRPQFMSVLTPTQEQKLRALLLDPAHGSHRAVSEVQEPGGK